MPARPGGRDGHALLLLRLHEGERFSLSTTRDLGIAAESAETAVDAVARRKRSVEERYAVNAAIGDAQKRRLRVDAVEVERLKGSFDSQISCAVDQPLGRL